MKPSLYEQLARDRERAHDAALKVERRDRELARMRYELAGLELDHAVLKLWRALKLRYSPDQPRVPAGQPGGGQWTDGGGQGRISLRLPASEAGPQARDQGQINLAVIKPEDHGLTVDQFVSRYCRGSINRELPGQFRGMTVGEMLAAKQGGDPAADKCYKLLNQQ